MSTVFATGLINPNFFIFTLSILSLSIRINLSNWGIIFSGLITNVLLLFKGINPIPFSVLLVIPLGIIGAVLITTMRGLENDVYFQVALLTVIGLSSKNAILIVEFVEVAHKNGRSLLEAAVEGAKLRLRPIIMTSLAFVVGVLPLALSTGAGANSRIAIGTGIVGGTLTATILGIFMIPLFYVLIRKLFKIKNENISNTVSNIDTVNLKEI